MKVALQEQHTHAFGSTAHSCCRNRVMMVGTMIRVMISVMMIVSITMISSALMILIVITATSPPNGPLSGNQASGRISTRAAVIEW